MGTMNTYTAYHATDKSNVQSIITSNFTFREKSTHWLGNGVYFFVDKSLAIDWGNNCPTTKYGCIKDPAVIEAIIFVDDDFVCDMRELETHNKVKHAFDIFWESVYKARYTAKYDNNFIEKLECAFFNWFTKKLGWKCIICNFQKRTLPIAKSKFDSMFSQFRLPYVETQICVKDISCITNRKELL
ncbi:MAG: hypothetical protein IJC99_01655 [Clostridia bacterium]|nr:hypothetical protein [Clostridia bacterium]